jgi:YbgC/YbaW family acyl-CoA thioester hydrolase
MGPPVETEERVRYSETDQMGVAHNKSYFEWFEIGRTEFCRKKGIPYKEIEAQGFYLVVVEAFCRYRKPLRYDQRFTIRVTLREAQPERWSSTTIQLSRTVSSSPRLYGPHRNQRPRRGLSLPIGLERITSE